MNSFPGYTFPFNMFSDSNCPIDYRWLLVLFTILTIYKTSWKKYILKREKIQVLLQVIVFITLYLLTLTWYICLLETTHLQALRILFKKYLSIVFIVLLIIFPTPRYPIVSLSYHNIKSLFEIYKLCFNPQPLVPITPHSPIPQLCKK